MADLDAVERLLCQRYNVRTLDVGELSRSLEDARGGNIQSLRDVLDRRELYRWHDAIFAALNEPEPVAMLEVVEESEAPLKPKGRKAKAEELEPEVSAAAATPIEGEPVEE